MSNKFTTAESINEAMFKAKHFSMRKQKGLGITPEHRALLDKIRGQAAKKDSARLAAETLDGWKFSTPVFSKGGWKVTKPGKGRGKSKIKVRIARPLASENTDPSDWKWVNAHDVYAANEKAAAEGLSGMKDSGKRQQFEGGAMRDTADNKPRLDLVSPFAMERLGHWLDLGSKKYQPRNWEQGMPTTRCVASALRHLMSYMLRRDDEDHLAAAFCNLMFLLHYDSMSSEFKEKWDDRPKYTTS